MKSIKKLVTRLPAGILFMLCFVLFVPFVLGQKAGKDDYPTVEVFVGYSALGTIGDNAREVQIGTGRVRSGYGANTGFETSVSRNFTRYIGLKGDFSAHFKNDSGRGFFTSCAPTCTTTTLDFQFKTRVYEFLAGPEFKARNRTRFTPFAHVLAGLAHTSASVESAGPPLVSLKRSDTSFAMALGGGLDIRATNRVSFRGQMDYNPVFIHDPGNGRRDLARISLGVLFH
jgi:opacity protein-like surface antigen